MKPWLKLGSVTVTLAFLAACSSNLGVDAPSLDEPSLSTQAVTVSNRVPNSASDAEEFDGNVYTTSTVLEMVEKSSSSTNYQQVGVRFTGVNVPKNATITGAYVEFEAATNLSDSASLTVYGDDVASSGPFGSGSSAVSARSKTSAKVIWAPGAWTDGQLYKSANLTPIVKEITSRSDWATGNAMAFMISGTGNRKALAYDSSSATAPKLVVTYDTGTVTPPPSSAVSCLGSSYDKTGTRTVTGGTTGASYLVRGGTSHPNYRLDATGLSVRSPKSQIKDGKPAPRQAFLISYNYTTSGNPVSVCVHGGEVEVVVPVNEQWEPYYHGNGSFYVEKSPGAIIESVASIRGGDGFTIKDMERTDKAKIAEELKTPIIVRDSYIGRAGDDGVENDRLNNVTVDNVLIDSAFQGFSCQQETALNDPRRSVNGGKRDFVIKNTLLALRREKGGSYSSYKLWKWVTGEQAKLNESNTNCKLYLRNNVFLITERTDNVKIDPAEYNNVNDVPIVYSQCQGNTIVYTGGNASYWTYLKNTAAKQPNCWRVTQDVSVWKNARANWFKNHPQFAKYEADEDSRYNFK